jgi:MoaA/NifB/PqqE/SkfB family radical SAM enzyme
MKIALCFSGQLRTALHTYENILNYIGDLYKDCDVFVHTWNVRTDMHSGKVVDMVDERTFVEFKRIYTPKKMVVEDFLLYSDLIEPIFHTLRMSDEMRKEYEKESDVKYDFIIKIRPDILFNPDLRLINEITEILKSDYENTIYTLDCISNINNRIFEDIFWIATPNVFEFINDYYDLSYNKNRQISWQNDMPIYFDKWGLKYEPLPVSNEGMIYPWLNVEHGNSVKNVEREWRTFDYNVVRVKYYLFYNMIKYGYIETTNHCNLNCSFCNRRSVIGNLQHMPLSKYIEIIMKLRGAPISDIKLMGMGEPFFHPEYDKICKVTKEHFPNTNIISSTNCQYKINKVFKDSLKYIDILYFSIDGYQESYEKNREGATWTRLIEFLEEFKNVDRYNCKIVINYVVNPNNVQYITKVYDEILLKYNINELRLNIAQNWNENEHINNDYTEEQITYLRDNWRGNIKGDPNWNYNKCFWVHNGIYITVDGGMKVCCLNTEVESFGNVFEREIDQIRYTPKFNDIRVGCVSNNPTDHCKNCSYKELVPILSKILND